MQSSVLTLFFFFAQGKKTALSAPESDHDYSVVLDMEGMVGNPNIIIFAFFLFQNGFDYLLTYSDNPQTVFPRYCVSWMVSSGEWVLVYRAWNLG